LKRTDKFGDRISSKQKDIVELENNLNWAIIENKKVIEEMEEFDRKKKALEEGIELSDEEDETEEEKSMETRAERKKTSLANLRKRIDTRRVDRSKLTYIRKEIFLQADAVFADPPTMEELNKIKRDIGYENKAERSLSFNMRGFSKKGGVLETFEDINRGNAQVEVELHSANQNGGPDKQEGGQADFSVESDAMSELEDTMIHKNLRRNQEMDDRKAISNYIIDNRETTNDIVRSAEINNILFQNLSLRPFTSLPSALKFFSLLNLPISILTYFTVLPTTATGYTKARYILNPIFGGAFLYYIISYGQITDLAYKTLWCTKKLFSDSL